MSERPRPLYPIESVDNALRLLLMLEERGSIRLVEAARELGVASSTAHRLMSMLTYHGFAERGGDGLYKLGPALLQAGLSAVDRLELRTVLRPYVDGLVRQLDETVHVAQLEGPQVLFIDSMEGAQPLRVSSRLGRALPAHATSVGRVLLAQLSERELAALYPDGQLPPQPEAAARRSASTLTELIQVLTTVRRQGYARNFEESEKGVRSVGVAISRRLVTVPTGVSIAVPTVRADARRLRLLVQTLIKTVAEIESELMRDQPYR